MTYEKCSNLTNFNALPTYPIKLPVECLISQALVEQHQEKLAKLNWQVYYAKKAVEDATDRHRKACDTLEKAENIKDIMADFFAASPRWTTTEECEEMQEEVEKLLYLDDN